MGIVEMRRPTPLLGLVFTAIAVVHGCVGTDPAAVAPEIDGGAPEGGGPAPIDSGTVPPVDGGGDADQDAGPFDPSTYGRLELWLRGDVGVVVAGTSVTSWKDSSPQARVVKLPTGDGRCMNGPTVVSDAINGLPGVRFDGQTQCMTVGGAFRDFTNGLTFFAVFLPENCNSVFTGNGGALLDSYDNSASSYLDGLNIGRNPTPAQTPTGDALLTANGGVGITGGGSWVPNTPEVLTFRLPVAPGESLVTGTAFVNGVSKDPNPNAPKIPGVDSSRTTTFLGYSALSSVTTSAYPYYCGSIAELLVYSKALTDDDRAAVEKYLRSRFKL